MVGIRVQFEAAGHPVQIEREKNGFAMDLVGDGGVFIPAASLAEALAFLDEVRKGLEESERMFVAMVGGPQTQALALIQPVVTAVPVNGNGNGRVHREEVVPAEVQPEERKRRPLTDETRAQIVSDLRANRLTVKEIAERAKCSIDTVYSIRKQLAAAAEPADGERVGDSE